MTIETKYNVGDEVWAYHWGKGYRGTVHDVSIHKSDTQCLIACSLLMPDGEKTTLIPEEVVYPTKDQATGAYVADCMGKAQHLFEKERNYLIVNS